MTKFMKVIVLFFGVTGLFMFASCAAAQEAGNYVNDYISESTQDSTYDDDTVEASGGPGGDNSVVPVVHTPFTGERGRRHNFLWPVGRDGDWELDIVRFAEAVLAEHPLFNDISALRNNRRISGEAWEDYYYFAYNTILQRVAASNGILAHDADGIREALRNLLILKVNELIIDIPNRNDFEIKYGLAEIAVILGDGHTHPLAGWPPWGRIFPLEIAALHNGIYLIGVPYEIEHTLYSELLAINGIYIDEVIDRFARVLSHENEYYLRQAGLPSFMMISELLQYLDVTDDSGAASFTVRAVSGEVFDAQIQAVERDSFDNMTDTEFIRHEFDTLMHTNSDYAFWHEYFQGDSLLYVRISSFSLIFQDITQPAIDRLRGDLANWPDGERIEKLILDLRQNMGGNRTLEWPAVSDFPVLAERVDSLYVLTDGASYSLSVLIAFNLRSHMKNVTIVGEPTGQPENFFSGRPAYLPNSNLRYRFSLGIWANSNSEDVAIRPDVFIPLTIEDIMANCDPVLEFIFGG